MNVSQRLIRIIPGGIAHRKRLLSRNAVLTEGKRGLAWALVILAAGESRTITVNVSVLSALDVPADTRVTATDANVIDNVNRITTTAVSN